MSKFSLYRRSGILISIFAASLGNYALNISVARTAPNLEVFSNFSNTFLLYITILSANRSIFAEGLRSNNFLGMDSKQNFNGLIENSLTILPISIILIMFGPLETKILGVFLVPLILHDNIRYIFLNENKIRNLIGIDFAWTASFLLIYVSLEISNKVNFVSIFVGWAFPTIITVIFFGKNIQFQFDKSNLLKFPWLRSNISNIKFSALEYLTGAGFSQILILTSSLLGTQINSSSFRICQILFFPLVLIQTIEVLDKNAKSFAETDSKIVLKRDFNIQSVLSLSLVGAIGTLIISVFLLDYLTPDFTGFNYSILFSYASFLVINSILIPYYNVLKNTNNFRILQISRRYFIFPILIFFLFYKRFPELDKLLLLLNLSTIPMIYKLEKERRRLIV